MTARELLEPEGQAGAMLLGRITGRTLPHPRDKMPVMSDALLRNAADRKEAVLRVAMIGCGEVAFYMTAPALMSARNARLVLAMDIHADLAASMGRACNVPYTTDLQEVLRHPDIDAVLISAPHYQHQPLTLAAAAAGKHVMCEKPMACTLQQADQMIMACEAAGVHLGINMIARYEAATGRARALVASGAIGEVTAVNVHFTIQKPETYWDGGFTGRAASPWRRYWTSAGGGVLMINIVHELDRLCFVSGLHVVSASAEVGTLMTDVEVEDTATVSYRFSNGALGSITASSCAPGNRSFGLQIIGTEGQIILGAFAASLLREKLKKQDRTYALRRVLPSPLMQWFNRRSLQVFTVNNVPGLKRDRWTTVRVPLGTDPRRLYIESFADAVLRGHRPDICGEKGRQVLAAVLAAYDAAQAGTRVMIREEDLSTTEALVRDRERNVCIYAWRPLPTALASRACQATPRADTRTASEESISAG